MDWLFELLELIGTTISRMSPTALLIGLVAVMAFVALAAVVIVR